MSAARKRSAPSGPFFLTWLAPARILPVMARKTRYNIPVPTWTCPHCGFVHRPANLMRVDFVNLRCKQCGQIFAEQSADPQQKPQRLG
jgi:rubredoxin